MFINCIKTQYYMIINKKDNLGSNPPNPIGSLAEFFGVANQNELKSMNFTQLEQLPVVIKNRIKSRGGKYDVSTGGFIWTWEYYERDSAKPGYSIGSGKTYNEAALDGLRTYHLLMETFPGKLLSTDELCKEPPFEISHRKGVDLDKLWNNRTFPLPDTIDKFIEFYDVNLNRKGLESMDFTQLEQLPGVKSKRLISCGGCPYILGKYEWTWFIKNDNSALVAQGETYTEAALMGLIHYWELICLRKKQP